MPTDQQRSPVFVTETGEETWVPDTGPELPTCMPGGGCFMDPCKENSDCLSAWRVEHMGEGVCTAQCVDECPEGWACRQVASGGPDVLFLCISQMANLCRPCSTDDQCVSAGSTDDVCLDYGPEGSFCGAACDSDDPKSGAACPWGFTCKEAVTVAGIALKQCVADTGVCPCTVGDSCKDGACSGGPALSCDDANVCTDD
jgi:hypothetical protein